VNGGPGSDELIGDELDSPRFAPSNGNNDDQLMGGPGDDTVVGLGGNDTLVSGPGDDTLIGMGGDDEITGGPGLDTAFGGPGVDSIAGDPGDDTLFGNFGSDVISGGPGDDFIDGDNPSPPPPGRCHSRRVATTTTGRLPRRRSDRQLRDDNGVAPAVASESRRHLE
jgi:Ca2+-binding RTX toxin-like protein